MKKTLLYCGLLLASTVSFTSCDGEMELPPMIVPQYQLPENAHLLTVMELKELGWKDTNNYATLVEKDADGNDYYIKVRVCSSDATGNIFKNLYFQDETSGICASIDSYDLFEVYKFGQEVYINLTGMYMGRYSGLFELGVASGTSIGRMPLDVFKEHAHQDGLPDLSLMTPYTTSPTELASLKGTEKSLMQRQGRLIKVENVRFQNAGSAFAPASNTSRYVIDENGGRLNVYCSSYSDFKDDIIPKGNGSVTGVLSYYNNDWQLLLNDLEGLEGFEPAAPGEGGEVAVEPAGSGTLADPYNVAKALAIINEGTYTSSKVYVKGIISEISEIDTGSYGNATYFIADALGSATQLEVYRGYGLNGNKFTASDQIKVGDKVVVLGELTMFHSTPEITQGSSLVSINAE